MPEPGSLRGKTILITGGTGSFGKAFVRRVLAEHEPAAIRVYSRDELKQYDFEREMGADPRIRYLLGDVRDRDRLVRATRDVDVIVHAAALKQVVACEYNPFEAVQTNILGAENIVTAAIENEIGRTLALSTDKAVNPVNLYGATKLCAEKIITQGNSYAGQRDVRFASVRYGNVVGSRGSVVPLFKKQAEEGVITLTDERMTRFWITIDGAVDFVLDSLERMEGGEVFIPKIPSMRIMDIAEAIAPEAERRVTGIRPGEKIHEILLTSDEARHARSFPGYYAIYPDFPFWRSAPYPEGGETLPAGFDYWSGGNDEWISAEQLRDLVADVPALT